MAQPRTRDEPQDTDRTVLVPRPGGRSAPPADATATVAAGGAVPRPAPVQSAPPPVKAHLDVAAIRRHGSGLNPLVRAANPLLDLVVPLRYIAAHPDIDELRQNLVRAIKNFESEARAANVDAQSIAVARYALCTFLDETIASTPWGGGGAWASKSLLVAFHNEAWGGEKFFQILQRLAQEPSLYLHLLELMYLCLALGLEGRYRVIDGGRGQVEGLRERLQKMIQAQRGAHSVALSPRWQASRESRAALLEGVPIWGLATIAAAVILIVRMSLSLTLSQGTDPLLVRLTRIQVEAAPLAKKAPPAVPLALAPQRTIAGLLAPEIAYGQVSVNETPGKINITLRGEGVFASGSAEVANPFKPLLDRIGDALQTVNGSVLVIGHTDDQVSATASFPSNDELSEARADAVVVQLAARTGTPERFSSEGHGASEPLVPNNSPANRARNRRVDIIVSTVPDQE